MAVLELRCFSLTRVVAIVFLVTFLNQFCKVTLSCVATEISVWLSANNWTEIFLRCLKSVSLPVFAKGLCMCSWGMPSTSSRVYNFILAFTSFLYRVSRLAGCELNSGLLSFFLSMHTALGMCTAVQICVAFYIPRNMLQNFSVPYRHLIHPRAFFLSFLLTYYLPQLLFTSSIFNN